MMVNILFFSYPPPNPFYVSYRNQLDDRIYIITPLHAKIHRQPLDSHTMHGLLALKKQWLKHSHNVIELSHISSAVGKALTLLEHIAIIDAYRTQRCNFPNPHTMICIVSVQVGMENTVIKRQDDSWPVLFIISLDYLCFMVNNFTTQINPCDIALCKKTSTHPIVVVFFRSSEHAAAGYIYRANFPMMTPMTKNSTQRASTRVLKPSSLIMACEEDEWGEDAMDVTFLFRRPSSSWVEGRSHRPNVSYLLHLKQCRLT